MSNKDTHKSALRQYIVFRVKAIEFLDMAGLHDGLMNGSTQPYPPFRTADNMMDSLRTVQVSWLALFVDKNGMDVIKLWQQVFPQHAKMVKSAWTKMEPAWTVLREFRDRAGFHADSPLKFFGARNRFRSQAWGPVGTAILEFEKLFKFFLGLEGKELPDLEDVLDDLLDELEKAHGSQYKRAAFKAYLMIPNTKTK